MFPLVPKLPTLALPVTLSMPDDTKLPPLTFHENVPVTPVTAALEFTFAASTFPLVVRDVNVPTDVTLGCAAVANVPVNNVPETLPQAILPVTFRDVNVPTDVTLGCAAVVSVPVKLVNTAFVPPILPTLALPVNYNTLDAVSNVNAALAPKFPAPSLN